jgi:hypothetical protein
LPDIKPGDDVQWWDEDPDEQTGIYYIEPRFGMVMAVKTDGPLSVTNGRAAIQGTSTNPALLVQCFSSMGGDETTYELTNCLALLHASDVVKVRDQAAITQLKPAEKLSAKDKCEHRTMDRSEAALRLRERIVKGTA